MQKTDRIEGRHKQLNNNHRRLQYLTFNNRTTRQIINKEKEN